MSHYFDEDPDDKDDLIGVLLLIAGAALVVCIVYDMVHHFR